METKLALRLERDPAAARAILDRLERDLEARRFAFIGEMLDAWYGLALLLESSDAPALARLRSAVDRMRAADRIRELPAAAVYLAEAEWRAGNEEAADHAADLALDAARRQGSNHVLLQALADFPAVVSRRIDAEPGVDSPWQGLGRALITQGVTIAARVGVSVELKEFGSAAILVNGVEARPRIAKSSELLAYLTTRPEAAADRDELLDPVRRPLRRVDARIPSPSGAPAAEHPSGRERPRRRGRARAPDRRARRHERRCALRVPAGGGRQAPGR